MFREYREKRCHLIRLAESRDVTRAQIVDENRRLRETAYHMTLGSDIVRHQFCGSVNNAEYLFRMSEVKKSASRSPAIGREDLLAAVPNATDDGLPLLHEGRGRENGDEIVYNNGGVVLREDISFRELMVRVCQGLRYRGILIDDQGDMYLGCNGTIGMIKVSADGRILWRLKCEDFEGKLESDDFFSSITFVGKDIVGCTAKASKLVKITTDGRCVTIKALPEQNIWFVEFDEITGRYICVNEMAARIFLLDENLRIVDNWPTPMGKWRPVQVRRYGERFLVTLGRGGWQSLVQWYSADGKPSDVVFRQNHAPVHACKLAVFPEKGAVVIDHFGTMTGLDSSGNPVWRFALSGKQCRLYYGALAKNYIVYSDFGILRKMYLWDKQSPTSGRAGGLDL